MNADEARREPSRRRPAQVAVRLLPDEQRQVLARAAEQKISAAEVVRRALLKDLAAV